MTGVFFTLVKGEKPKWDLFFLKLGFSLFTLIQLYVSLIAAYFTLPEMCENSQLMCEDSYCFH